MCAGGEEAKGGEGGGRLEALGLQIGARGDLHCAVVESWLCASECDEWLNEILVFSKELLGSGLGL